MKVLVFVKATPNSEKGIVPDESFKAMFEAMGKYNEQLVAAGIMKEADGLKPSSAGKRIKFSDTAAPTVIDGPFAETKELVAGYWVWEVKSLDEAIEWAKKCPNPMPGEEGVIELRPTNSLEDFAELLTDEHRERYDNLAKKLARQNKAKSGKAKASSKPKVKAKKKAAPAPKKRKPAKAKSKK